MSFSGKLEGTSGDAVRIVLDATSADITAGGGGAGGDLLVADDEGRVTVRVSGGGEEGGFHLPPKVNTAVITISADPGSIVIRDPGGTQTAAVIRGREQGDVSSGELTLADGAGANTVELRAVHGDEASVIVGGAKRSGWIVLRNADGGDAAFLSGHPGHGQLELRAAGGNTIVLQASDVRNHASILVGGGKQAGYLVLRNDQNEDAVFLSGHDDEGLLELRRTGGMTTIRLDAAGASRFGGLGVNGSVLVYPAGATSQDDAEASVAILGESGDIVLRNADGAEDFDVDEAPGLAEGAVVALNDRGGLRLSDQPYDRRVAGVLSGAGGLRPGIVLGRTPGTTGRWPVALFGKVFCHADATYGAIEVGDLLTTSATPGHAMAARDPSRAFGAVLGKAVAPLRSGRGLIPVLVALQ